MKFEASEKYFYKASLADGVKNILKLTKKFVDFRLFWNDGFFVGIQMLKRNPRPARHTKERIFN